jgi:hypothetical protein
MFMLKAENLGKSLVVLFEKAQRTEGLIVRMLISRVNFGIFKRPRRLDEISNTSRSPHPCAAVANSPAARSCSSLAATGFDFRVSKTALRAWV